VTQAVNADATAATDQPMSQRGSVELTDVTKRFGSMIAVDRLNLQVQAGEFLSLLGPSGCGKTTTLRMLAGFEQPDEGFIRISGEFVQGIPPYKRDVNTVFQQYALFPHMSVAENVAYGLRQKGVSKQETATRVAEALDMVKMSKLAERKPRQMSGGQQQRVAVARARSSTGRACCSSTSRSARSTASCARRCRSSSSCSRASSGSRSSSSPTTRKRRWG